MKFKKETCDEMKIREANKKDLDERQTLVLGVYAREFPGGLLKLDPAFAYAEPPSS